jgi:hypothetical protein
MKIVKRVSLYRAVDRLGEPSRSTALVTQWNYEPLKEWKMPIEL